MKRTVVLDIPNFGDATTSATVVPYLFAVDEGVGIGNAHLSNVDVAFLV
jgi:hypothetical protein